MSDKLAERTERASSTSARARVQRRRARMSAIGSIVKSQSGASQNIQRNPLVPPP